MIDRNLVVSNPKTVCRHGDTHYRFPRLVCLNDGTLLLVYRIGKTHNTDPGNVGMRTSTDQGVSWSEERVVFRYPEGYSVQGPVPVVCRDGRIVLFMSRKNLIEDLKQDQYRMHSDDNGDTWSPEEIFDRDQNRCSYYLTDAIRTTDGLLGCISTFSPPGTPPVYCAVWHSGDDGRSWQVRSYLTDPQKNEGDEAAMLETEPGRILVILREREINEHTYRFYSEDGGRSWTAREDITGMIGVLQRPFLTRMSERTVLLTGRDRDCKTVVCFISEDNGRTFSEPYVIDRYRKDGAYTAAVSLSNTRALIVYYTDQECIGKPDLRSVFVAIKDD